MLDMRAMRSAKTDPHIMFTACWPAECRQCWLLVLKWRSQKSDQGHLNTVMTCRHNICIVKGDNSLPVAGEISASFSQPTNVAASHGIADLALSSNAKKSAPRANMESICSSPEHVSVQPSGLHDHAIVRNGHLLLRDAGVFYHEKA